MIVIKSIVPTYTATIYCGTRPGYTSKTVVPIQVLEQVCQEYCNKVGFGVTITKTTFIYTNGKESGIIVGIINYPRFPKSVEEIKDKAIELAMELIKVAKQNRVSIVCTDETIMIENEIESKNDEMD